MKQVIFAGLSVLFSTAAQADSPMRAAYDKESGQVAITEAEKPVLTYKYKSIRIPEGFFDGIPEKRLDYARKYAIPRSNYLHPLFGPDGEKITKDWNKDHAHHRGIYWAWPEVQFRGELGDLHALQKVWARPTGYLETRHDNDWAEVEAENRWMWDDQTPIVRELATIRAWKSAEHGRHVDLTFRFEALEDGVTLARRGTKAYGGLNIRLAPIQGMQLIHHADPAGSTPQMAWQAATGTWAGSEHPLSMVVLEKVANPRYPADCAKYPDLPWFQPTFPKTGERFPLVKGEPLTLRYRIWVRRGPPPTEHEFRAQWTSYNTEARKTQP